MSSPSPGGHRGFEPDQVLFVVLPGIARDPVADGGVAVLVVISRELVVRAREVSIRKALQQCDDFGVYLARFPEYLRGILLASERKQPLVDAIGLPGRAVVGRFLE